MNISIIINHGIILLLGTLVATFINHILNKDRELFINKAIARQESFDRFKHAFDTALFNAERADIPTTRLLSSELLNHEIAAWHFKNCLTGKTRDDS